MTFVKTVSIAISTDGTMTRSTIDTPAVVSTPGIRVSMDATTETVVAARLLRRLADELEAR